MRAFKVLSRIIYCCHGLFFASRLGRPPHLIMRIMDCVLILFKRKLDPVTPDPERQTIKPSWSEAMKMMTESGFLSNLQQFNKDTINDEVGSLVMILSSN